LYFFASKYRQSNRNNTLLYRLDNSNTVTLIDTVNFSQYSSSSDVLNETLSTPDGIFFVGNDGISGDELWIYDGLSRPKMVENILPEDNFPQSSFPHAFTLFKDKAFFSARGPEERDFLWSYSTSDGLEKISDITTPLDFSDSISELIVHKDILYIANEQHLWKYDGVNAPEILNKLSSDGSEYLPPLGPRNLLIHRGQLFFQGFDQVEGNSNLWFLDSNDDIVQYEYFPDLGRDLVSYGTDICSIDQAVICYDFSYQKSFESDINPEYERYAREILVVDGVLYMSAENDVNGGELWKYVSPTYTSNGEDIVEKNELFSGLQIYPNPSSGISNISVELSPTQMVEIKIFDLHGRPVAEVFKGVLSADRKRTFQNDLDLASGLYFYKIQGENFFDTQTFLIAK